MPQRCKDARNVGGPIFLSIYSSFSPSRLHNLARLCTADVNRNVPSIFDQFSYDAFCIGVVAANPLDNLCVTLAVRRLSV